MAITLHQLPPTPGRKKRRVGRGKGSGRGTYAGRGLKGQRSRSGGRKGLKLRGMKQFMMQVPKKRGFSSGRSKWIAVQLSALENAYESGSKVNEQNLLKKGIIADRNPGIKIIGSGKLTKKLTVEVSAFSESAKNAIINAGGRAIVSTKFKKEEKKAK